MVSGVVWYAVGIRVLLQPGSVVNRPLFSRTLCNSLRSVGSEFTHADKFLKNYFRNALPHVCIVHSLRSVWVFRRQIVYGVVHVHKSHDTTAVTIDLNWHQGSKRAHALNFIDDRTLDEVPIVVMVVYFDTVFDYTLRLIVNVKYILKV